MTRRAWFGAMMAGLAALAAGLATFSGQTGGGATPLQVYYWYVLPALPFLGLWGLAAGLKEIPLRGLMGAAGGALLAIGLPHVLLAVSLAKWEGGGANLGIGLLFLAQPIYLPVLMAGGALLAGWPGGKRETAGQGRA